MKKYLQISIVLSIFGLFVLLKQAKGSEVFPSIGVTVKFKSPTDATFVTPTATPVQNTPATVQTPTPVSSASPRTTAQTPAPTVAPTPAANNMMGGGMMGKYKNGTYTGSVEDAYYGNIQVQAVISGGRITDVVFLQYPNDNSTSQYINSQAMPLLKQEAIAAQNAQVDIISGASATSPAFQASLANALAQAKI